jgi:hypothetical protein
MWSRDKVAEPSYVWCWYVHEGTNNERNVPMYTGHDLLPIELTDILTYRWMCILLLLLLLLLFYGPFKGALSSLEDMHTVGG